MNESPQQVCRHQLSLSVLNTTNLLHGLCTAESELQRAVIGFPSSAHSIGAYKRICEMRKELRQIIENLNPTVFFKDDYPVVGPEES